MRGLGAVLFLVCAIPAFAQGKQEEPTPLPCEQTPLVIKLNATECFQFGRVLLAVDGARGAGPSESGAIAAIGAVEGFQVSTVSTVPDRADVYIRSTPESQVPDNARGWNSWTRGGRAWSVVRSLDNAWVVMFERQGAACVYFDNYGRYHFSGYEWNVEGVACRTGGNAAASLSDDDIRGVMALVVPKKR